MALITAIRRAPTEPVSAARQRLAERIAESNAAAERVPALETILEQAAREMREARAAVAPAREAAEEAVGAAAAYATARLLGTAGAPPKSTREARAELQEKLDAAEVAETAWRNIETELAKLRAGNDERARDLAEAAAAVMAEEGAPAIAALIAGIDDLERRLIQESRALLWLLSRFVVADRGPGAVPGAMRARCLAENLSAWSAYYQSDAATATERKWAQAFDALRHDAAAAVPR